MHSHKHLAAGALLSLTLYVTMAYGLERHQTGPLFAMYFALFVMYAWVIRRKASLPPTTLPWLTAAGLLFRAALLFSIPALSDDFYRFIWDGRVWSAGYHPFAEVPSWYLAEGRQVPGLDPALFEQLNSPHRFTSYPPVCQFIYWLTAQASPTTVFGSVVVMKLILLCFEVANLVVMQKTLALFGRDKNNVLIYALNPLVILEISGNLHFEGVMIFFLLVSVYLLKKGMRFASAFAFALSVATKLIPLLFLPVLVRYIGWKKSIVYGGLVFLFTVSLFLPLLSPALTGGMATALGYYFQRFEFNASIYYLVREIGYLFAGFNIIQYAGPALAMVAAAVILYISFRNFPKQVPGEVNHAVFETMMWCLFVYFLSTTILHPWYVITLVALGAFTSFRFPLVWSGLIFLTYAGYTVSGFREDLVLVTMEYLLLFTYLYYEVAWMKRENPV